MFRKIWKLNRVLKESSRLNKSNLVVLGDLNTMGKSSDITSEEEVDELAETALSHGMRMLSKDFDKTWHQWGVGPWGNRRPLQIPELATADMSDLDHVIVSRSINLSPTGVNSEEVHVKGWNQMENDERIDFLWEISDHSAIYGEIDTSVT